MLQSLLETISRSDHKVVSEGGQGEVVGLVFGSFDASERGAGNHSQREDNVFEKRESNYASLVERGAHGHQHRHAVLEGLLLVKPQGNGTETYAHLRSINPARS